MDACQGVSCGRCVRKPALGLNKAEQLLICLGGTERWGEEKDRSCARAVRKDVLRSEQTWGSSSVPWDRQLTARGKCINFGNFDKTRKWFTVKYHQELRTHCPRKHWVLVSRQRAWVDVEFKPGRNFGIDIEGTSVLVDLTDPHVTKSVLSMNVWYKIPLARLPSKRSSNLVFWLNLKLTKPLPVFPSIHYLYQLSSVGQWWEP